MQSPTSMRCVVVSEPGGPEVLELCERPILAGCPTGGLVLDPFMGSGTTAVVAKRLCRNFIGFELSPAYILMANQRLKGGGRNGKTRTRVQ